MRMGNPVIIATTPQGPPNSNLRWHVESGRVFECQHCGDVLQVLVEPLVRFPALIRGLDSVLRLAIGMPVGRALAQTVLF